MPVVETLSLEQILSYVEITGIMYETTTGLPDPLPEAFKGQEKKVVGDEARVMVRRGQRQTARRVEYGGKARNRELISIGYKDVKCVHFTEEIGISLNLLHKLRDTTSYTNQQQGRDELAEQATQFAELFRNTEIVMRQMVLSKGHIYFDAEGNILPTSSGAVLDIDYGLSSTHINQLNGIIAASWANVATDIPSQVIHLVDYAAPRETGLEIEYAFYTKEIPGYIFKNTFAQAYLARNPGMNQQFLDRPTQIPNGLFGIKNWVPVARGFFADKDLTNQDIWAADTVCFTPDPAKGNWWKNFKGSVMVPKSLDVAGQGTALLDNAEIAYGMGGYGFVERSPIKGVMNYFWTGLPALQNADAIWVADVVP